MYRMIVALSLLSLVSWTGSVLANPENGPKPAGTIELAQVVIRPGRLTVPIAPRVVVPSVQLRERNSGPAVIQPVIVSGAAFIFNGALSGVSLSGRNLLSGRIVSIDFGGVRLPLIVDNDARARAGSVPLRMDSSGFRRSFRDGLRNGDVVQVTAENARGGSVGAPIGVRVSEIGREFADVDADGDGRDSFAFGGDDCDDGDTNRFPGNVEIADFDGHDEDCDPMTIAPPVAYTRSTDGDLDGDAFIDDRYFNTDDSGRRIAGRDCDDTNPQIHPFQVEARNAVDDDCDGAVDEGLLN